MAATKKKADYWEEKVDSRKMAIKFVSHIWIVLCAVIAGAILGAALYSLYHLITDKVSYQGYSEFYLDFATDEKGDAYQWYNGYTWTGLMSAEPIVSSTLEQLDGTGLDVSSIEKDTVAEIKSDIRVLRVTFTENDPELCEKLQCATQNALVKLGDTAKEFNSISVIKTSKPERVLYDDRTVQAIELGALAGLAISLICLWIYLILDERIMTISDLEGLGLPVLGARLKQSDEKLAVFLSKLCDGNTEAALSGNEKSVISPDEIYRLNLGTITDSLETQTIEEAIASKGVIIEVPYRKVSRSSAKLVIDSLRNRSVTLIGICITDADNKFYKTYYFLNK